MIKAQFKPANSQANLYDYDQVYPVFEWESVNSAFTWNESGFYNIVHEAVDRWADDPELADSPALIYESDDSIENYTFRRLSLESKRYAAALSKLKLNAGHHLIILLSAQPDVYLFMLACARMGVVFSVLSPGLSFDDLKTRLEIADASCLVTTNDYLEKIDFEEFDKFGSIIILDSIVDFDDNRLTSWESLIDKAEDNFESISVDPGTPLFIAFTPGAAGPPKGIIHSHRGMAGYLVSARWVLNLSPGDILWTDAEPSWITGTVYSAFAPWLCGAASVISPDMTIPANCYKTLEINKVKVWYTTPSRIKSLISGGTDLPRRYDLSNLKYIFTAGSMFSPEMFYWVKTHLKLIPHDTWWMAETGMICLANLPSLPTKPGSMGKPLPGIKAYILDDSGKPVPELTAGQLAIKPDFPNILTGTLPDLEIYNQYFNADGLFLSGDIAFYDEDGYFYHQGRLDDMIKVGNIFTGPFEIENAARQHPQVIEAAAVLFSENKSGHVINLFLVINPIIQPTKRLRIQIENLIRSNFSYDLPPLIIDFIDKMPRNSQGKIVRLALRAKSKGLPLDD